MLNISVTIYLLFFQFHRFEQMCPNLWLVLFSCVYIKSKKTICFVYINTDLFYKVSRHITVELLQQFSSSLSPALQNKHNIVQYMCHFWTELLWTHLCLPSQFCYWWEKSCRKDQSMTRIKSIFYIVQSDKFIHNHTITKNLFKIVTKTRQWLAGQWLYLFPTSSPDTLCPSTMVKAPIPKKQSRIMLTIIYMNSCLSVMIWGTQWEILIPGSTRFLSISVPVAVALMRHTWAFSSASCPWSPHNLIQT